jgi:Fe-S oxidoreductase
MKIEFLYHYRKRHGLTLKDRLIAYLPRYAPRASRFAFVMNLRDQMAGLASLSEKRLGLSARRSLPKWRRDAFREVSSSGTTSASNGKGEVILLIDTFNRYFEPENGSAALAVLTAAGYRVRLPAVNGERPLCCGRTFLAAGLVDEARAEARRVLTALKPYAERGVPVVGLEPSCLFTLRDEFKAMLPGADTQTLAQRAVMLEEFLAQEQQAGKLDLKLKPLEKKKALLHGHCHQKAFAVMPAVQKALKLVPGLEVETIESSCCGMAGAFGYEAAHYDLSMRMAELSLLPKVREAAADTLIVADGTSCRHQIKDGAGREALHVARVLEAALA